MYDVLDVEGREVASFKCRRSDVRLDELPVICRACEVISVTVAGGVGVCGNGITVLVLVRAPWSSINVVTVKKN